MTKSALVAMSGGVDSSVAALLAVRDGYNCAGAMMRLYPRTPYDGDACCADDDTHDARAAADKLRIPFYVFDFLNSFNELVIKRFADAYKRGETPNPCVDCNKHLKFEAFLKKAHEIGKTYIITGHYARIEYDGDRYLLKKGTDETKDQSYVLYSLNQNQLSHTVFPLGGMRKSEVRALSHSEGFLNADKQESQDICFVPDGSYSRFIEEYTGEASRPGYFVDSFGNVLGRHKGIIHYTVGQRKGLGLSMPHPAYVTEIRPESGEVVVGSSDMLFSKTLTTKDINLIPFDKLDMPLRAHVKIRYKQPEQPATVYQISEDTLRIEFDSPQRAITRGQAAVIYDGDIVIGGGTIV